MISVREFPKRVFKTKTELFEALKEHETRLKMLKCSQVYKSIDKLNGFKITPFLNKSFTGQAKSEPWMKKDHIYPIINTTRYFDGHKDVHFDGIWNRSLKANVGKLYYVEAHSLKIADVISWPEDVRSFVKMVPWTLVGKGYKGETQALVYEIHRDNIEHSGAQKVIDEQREMQNSVRMQYIKIELAIDSDAKEWKENKELYDERIDLIANKEDVQEDGFFWAVDEAKIFKEGSMVIAGSNDATTIDYNNGEPAASTSPKGTGESHSEKDKARSKFLTNLI